MNEIREYCMNRYKKVFDMTFRDSSGTKEAKRRIAQRWAIMDTFTHASKSLKGLLHQKFGKIFKFVTLGFSQT